MRAWAIVIGVAACGGLAACTDAGRGARVDLNGWSQDLGGADFAGGSGADLAGGGGGGADFAGGGGGGADFAGGGGGGADFAGGGGGGADFAGGGGGADLAGGGGTQDFATPHDLSSTQVPCTRGPGFVAWRFHYSSSSTSSILDIYGLPDSSNWEAVAVYPTSIVDSGQGLEIASGNWILIRYSVSGLSQINSATLSVQARSYTTGGSGSFDAWTPLYGDDATAPDAISVYPYSWTSVDFTGFVQPGDDPGLTGIRLYAGPSSNDLSIHAVELCIDGQ
jgi:hypothetical protein